MKNTLTLLLVTAGLLTTAFAQAQPGNSRAELARRQLPFISRMVQSSSHDAAKGAGMAERLIKEVDYNDYSNGYEITDSARFFYSGTRHSVYNSGYISLYNLDDAPSTDFRYLQPSPNNYDSTFRSQVSFDSMLHYSLDNGSGLVKLAHTEARIYNLDGSINTATVHTFQPTGASAGGNRQVVVYTAAGRMSRVFAFRENGAAYDTVSIRILAYDANGHAILDSSSDKNGAAFVPVTRSFYTYNAAGAVLTNTQQLYVTASSTFVTTNRYTYTYYPSGQLRTTVTERAQTIGAPVLLAQKDSFAYTLGVQSFTYNSSESYDATGQPLNHTVLAAVHFTAAGLPDSMIFRGDFSGTYTDIFSYKLVYNAARNPTALIAYDLQNPPPVPIFGYDYYYELYDNGVGVGPLSAAAAGISLSPNPAAGSITLHYPGAKAGVPICIRISGMNGQLAYVETLIPQAANTNIALDDALAPGLYSISVLGEADAVLYRGTFLKQ